MQMQPGGRVNISGLTLQNLIQQAWNLGPDMLAGAPKWIGDDRWDIVAKAPGSLPIGIPDQEEGAFPGRGVNYDRDAMLVMLQALLKDRFNLVMHEEEHPGQGYTLLAVKPKMKKADPNSRARFAEGAGADGKDPRNSGGGMNSRLITAQNVTMAEFAARLQSLAGGYIRSPVLDATGLEGSYDFTLNFSPAGMVGMAGGRGAVMVRVGPGSGGEGGGAGGAPEAADPIGAISLPEAVEKQLGLKLEMQKRPIKVWVIDKLERTPTDN